MQCPPKRLVGEMCTDPLTHRLLGSGRKGARGWLPSARTVGRFGDGDPDGRPLLAGAVEPTVEAAHP